MVTGLNQLHSPDGKQIVSGSWDMTIRIWDAETGQMIGELLAGHTKSAESVVFSLDGRQIVSGSGDKTIRIWDVEVKLNSFMQTTNLVRNYFFGTKISLQTNGWVYGPNNELPLWILPLHHLGLHLPQTLKVIGAHETVLDFSPVVWGSQWAACYTPPEATEGQTHSRSNLKRQAPSRYSISKAEDSSKSNSADASPPAKKLHLE